MSNSVLFGLPMSRKKRNGIIVCFIIAAMLFLIYIITGFFVPVKEIPVVIPSGELSESVFDAQNMTYRKHEALSNTYSLQGIPYSVDVPNVPSVMVNTAVVYSSEPYYILIDVIGKDDDLATTVKEDLTSIIELNDDSNCTNINCIKQESGYINGCVADYYVVEILVSSARTPEYLVLYALNIDESIYPNDRIILIGVMSHSYTTQVLENCKELAITELGTLRYDQKRDEKEFQ